MVGVSDVFINAVLADRGGSSAKTGIVIFFPCINTRSHDADIDSTLDSSRRNSAPRMQSIPLSFFVTIKFEQKSAG